MIRLIATGVWICLVTIASSYTASVLYGPSTAEAEADKFFGGLESVTTSQMSVPVIADGSVQGYVLAQFSFTIKADLLRRMSVKPDIFLLDAAFRSIYGGDASTLRNAEKQDLQALTAKIKDQVNVRFDEPFVDEVLVEKYTFLAKDEVRDGAKLIKSEAPAKSGKSGKSHH